MVETERHSWTSTRVSIAGCLISLNSLPSTLTRPRAPPTIDNSFLPYVGMVTIALNDYPNAKYILVGLMALFVLTSKE